MLVNPKTLASYLEQVTFANNGDEYERRFGMRVMPDFPNCERFWRVFVVPLTMRMEGYPERVSPAISFRELVDPRLQDIAAAHYSIFVNLVYADAHLRAKGLSWVSDAYVHLATACDLVDSVLGSWHLLLLDCREQRSHVLEALSLDEFLEYAKIWYGKHYQSAYEYYLTKGKVPPQKLPSANDLLVEYLGKQSDLRKSYEKHALDIRTFRNLSVHNGEVGRLVIRRATSSGVSDVPVIPKPSMASDFRTWRDVVEAASDPERVRKCFVEPAAQISSDIITLEKILNKIWETHVISDFLDEFYSPSRAKLRGLYGIEFQLSRKSKPKSSSGPRAAVASGTFPYLGSPESITSRTNDLPNRKDSGGSASKRTRYGLVKGEILEIADDE